MPDAFASALSLQCAYECFMGDADIRFIEEVSRIYSRIPSDMSGKVLYFKNLGEVM